MKIRKFLTATMIATALVSVAACGDDSSDAPPVPTANAATTTGDSSAAPAQPGAIGTDITNKSKPPSLTTLNAMITKALDPEVANSEKVVLVEGSEKDPAIFKKLVAAKKANPNISYELVAPVTRQGPKRAKVTVQVATPDNPPTSVDATIVYDDGRWKLSNETVCLLLSAYNEKSAMCPAAS
ncbi:hypothetical protein QSJ18_11770 [Gordonia sp. ABSL1-1]|uniref:hypothetical protein n=1 Tax=Gordonia sp. ABSL1-1 TaxID=3053923 RepID=UPI002572D7EF|nr:hypothetical protein [Gordonia sp. ABSL1-1]MDL9937424.1 hypothetical protein [Gordonia sp. ABSL1-1]